jgi:hypothetical protein
MFVTLFGLTSHEGPDAQLTPSSERHVVDVQSIGARWRLSAAVSRSAAGIAPLRSVVNAIQFCRLPTRPRLAIMRSFIGGTVTTGFDVNRSFIWGMAAVRPANVAGSDVVHSSGSPALRTPSIAFGTFGECAINHLTVRLGLRRRASAKADFASSILPSSA